MMDQAATQSRDPKSFCNECGCMVQLHDPRIVQSRMLPPPGITVKYPPPDTEWECYAYVNGGRCGCKAIMNPLVTA